jgi:hypothetical protein
MTETTYSIRCDAYESWATGHKKIQGGCGERPLSRALALKMHVVCGCGLEWPFVSLVAHYTEATSEGSVVAAPEAAHPPAPLEPPVSPPEKPHSARLRAKMAQGNLFS